MRENINSVCVFLFGVFSFFFYPLSLSPLYPLSDVPPPSCLSLFVYAFRLFNRKSTCPLMFLVSLIAWHHRYCMNQRGFRVDFHRQRPLRLFSCSPFSYMHFLFSLHTFVIPVNQPDADYVTAYLTTIISKHITVPLTNASWVRCAFAYLPYHITCLFRTYLLSGFIHQFTIFFTYVTPGSARRKCVLHSALNTCPSCDRQTTTQEDLH